MAQIYNSIAATQLLQDSLVTILARDDAAASNFAGTTFPTTGLLLGQFTYRTDTSNLYLLTDATTPVWSQVLTKTQADAVYASTGNSTITGTMIFQGNLATKQDTNTIAGTFGRYSAAYAGTKHLYADTSGGANDPTFVTWAFGASGVERMRLTNAGALTVTTSSGTGTVWTSKNQGAGSGLDADTVATHPLSYLLAYGNHTGTPTLSDAASTTVAVIRAGVPIGNYAPLASPTLTGLTSVHNGNFRAYNDGGYGTGPVIFSWDESASYASGFRCVAGETQFVSCDAAGNSLTQIAVFSAGGRIFGAAHGWLDDAFANRAPLSGEGALRAGGNCGDTPSGFGYEIYDYGNGQHQLRGWQENCYNCGTGNCNCVLNCGGINWGP